MMSVSLVIESNQFFGTIEFINFGGALSVILAVQIMKVMGFIRFISEAPTALICKKDAGNATYVRR